MFLSVGHVWAVFLVCKYTNRENCCRTFCTSPCHRDENGRYCCWPDVTVRSDYRYVMHNSPAINYKLSCFTSGDTVDCSSVWTDNAIIFVLLTTHPGNIS